MVDLILCEVLRNAKISAAVFSLIQSKGKCQKKTVGQQNQCLLQLLIFLMRKPQKKICFVTQCQGGCFLEFDIISTFLGEQTRSNMHQRPGQAAMLVDHDNTTTNTTTR